MTKVLAVGIIFLFGFASFLFSAQTEPVGDESAIRQAALDYIESWYDGNAERMEKCLHPDLAKRRVLDAKKVDNLNSEGMVRLTKGKAGTGTAKEKQQKDVTVLDIHESMASVKVVSVEFVDYLHLAKIEGRWLIVNALWDFK